MKRILKIYALGVSCAMAILFFLPRVSAFAEEETVAFPDIGGHWAEEKLNLAVEDGILNGYTDGFLRPDESVSLSEALTIACRVLEPQAESDVTALGLDGSEWYAPSVSGSLSMDIDFDEADLKSGMLTRSEAFSVLADAFQLVPAEPDHSVLESFSDAPYLSETEKDVFSALVSAGYVEGYLGKLDPERSVSRAEFITVLYRIAGKAAADPGASGAPDGGVITEGGVLTGKVFSAPVFFGCNSTGVRLVNVTSELTVFRSQVSDFAVLGNSKLERLVIAGGNTESFVFSPGGISSVETLVIGDMVSDRVIVSGNISRVEITGDDLTVTLNARVDELVIRGKNCAVTGNGSAKTLLLKTSGSTCDVSCDTVIDDADRGIADAVITLSAPDTLAAGETLKATAGITAVEDRACTAVWTVDGKTVKEERVLLRAEGTALALEHDFTYTKDMALHSDIGLTLSCVTRDGELSTAASSVGVTLENYPRDYYGLPADEVLKLVTSTYAGDYTLEWAENNDYTDAVKEIWVNAKGHSSSTKYLIWINRTYQRVNVFEGSAGNWKLVKSFLVGTGSDSTPTPVGVYTVFARSARGWTTSSYNCRPVVNFKIGSGYAFHSRLYDPTHSYLTDASIGFPVSHGCIRMYDEDIQWIYDNIPNKTTVVVH